MCAAGLHCVGNEVSFFVFEGEVALFGMNGAIVFAEEVPSQYKVVNQVSYYATGHAHMAAFNAKLHVDASQGFHFAAINAYSFAMMGLKVIFVEVGMTSKKVFADTGPLAAGVAERGTRLAVDLGINLSPIFRFGFFSVIDGACFNRGIMIFRLVVGGR